MIIFGFLGLAMFKDYFWHGTKVELKKSFRMLGIEPKSTAR